ncbi:choice-of-anchor D domain-containing protein [Acidicapsa acidisoli]|uniref:choice-of-anchor D domain-containing protein n=1 Tax=Acidicapsa acidisoli TaxID=1615681 RepID=UPI0021E04A3A|nr:choice-of-anchor D domain-containing protein [Acidicapsa acidisoli]
MQVNYLKKCWKIAILVATPLLLPTGVALGQVSLTAAPTAATLPDGSSVPMWGYTCGPVTSTPGPTCSALNPNAGGGWSPVVITVPTGTSLTINLTNNLTFANGNSVPTSLTIVGQLGGGLGKPTTVASPVHPDLGVTWPVAGSPGGGSATFTPPAQGPRVQSFGTEVAAGATTPLIWSSLRPGTYLLESGTHPSVQGTMGLYGIVVVTTAPTSNSGNEVTPGTAYPAAGSSPAVSYDAEVPLIFSEIDPVQNTAVTTAINTAGFSETMVWSGQPGGCGDPTPGNAAYHKCYPPIVNYTPLYYLINGVAFNKTSATASLFPVTPSTLAPSGATGSVLVRMVNAGARMHVPSIVGSQTGVASGTSTAPPSGFSLIAEDGNPLPGIPRVQSEVFMSAGKTYDVMINASAPTTPLPPALAVYDRELSLSANAIGRDAGMLAYISINGSRLPPATAIKPAVANPDSYLVVPTETLTISDPGKGVIANDVNVYGVKVSTPPAQGTLTLNANGTFTYVPNSGWSGGDSFQYQANGNGPIATVTLNAATIESAANIVMNNSTFTSRIATFIKIPSPGVLLADKDTSGYPLTVVASSVTIPSGSGLTVQMDAKGGFIASVPSPGIYTFTYNAQNSQGTVSAASATVTLTFPRPSNLAVSVVDGATKVPLAGQDYRWIIEEDKTFYVDPTKTTNTGGNTIVPTYGTNFHTSNMPFVAQGCTGPKSCEAGQTVFDSGTPCTSAGVPAGCSPTAGQHVPAVCDLGNGKCRPDTTGQGQTPTLPSQVYLDPTKRYYISVLPGDAADPFTSGCSTPGCVGGGKIGHGMGGASIAAGQTSVTVITQPSPYPPGKLSVFVFEDDFPLNGEQDAGGGVDVLATNEPGLGGFQIHLWDAMGGNGDFTGQMTYDMFNQPLTNSLQGTIDPVTGNDTCYISQEETQNITGMIVTCPKYEVKNGQVTSVLSPLAGQALIDNLMPGRWGVIATPAADRIARGEEWHQTNTLDGQKAHDSFIRIGEPSFFQEFGPAGYHVTIGFANPAIIQGRLAGVCAGTDAFLSLPAGSSCNNTVTGNVTTERMSRTPDERLYSSGSHDSFYWTQCYVSLGDPDGEDFAFTKCDEKGHFSFTGIPPGDWRVTVFDQWNDMLVDGLSTPVGLANTSTGSTANLGDIAMNQWQANVYTRTFIDDNKDGVSQASEGGIPLVPVAVRYRDGSLANGLSTDFDGTANFNETFPLFNWYVVETDTTRYKNTGTHVVYDSGGPADGSASCGQPGYPACGKSTIGAFLANTDEPNPVPANLQVPGSVYCGVADCTDVNLFTNPTGGGPGGSTGRVDSPWTGGVEGWQGFSGQNNFIEFGKEPYVPGETGGIKGHVVYASTRPFDDPQMLVQTQWEPLVPHVTINLYQEGTAPDGTQSLTLVDTTQTSSWDDYAQGFRADGVTPNMNCPGQSKADLFYFTLYNQPNYLNVYDSLHGGPAAPQLPDNSQYKCYDGMHNWNQIQPAPYDGMYKFPSVTATDATGKPTASACTICKPNTAVPQSDLYYGTPMLPAGKYVVEVVPPAGYEIVKEEDKNILIGDNFIAPVTQEFGGLGDIFIMPDQAQVAAYYNENNAQNSTTSLGANPNNGIVPGFVPEPTWPCVGEARVVPDYISLFPQSTQVAPFAGATRNLCDRKEVTLSDQTAAIAKFYIYTSTHIASKFTGDITDDFTSEFDPFSPQFGEKFSPPNMPVSVKDWTGAEISRVYTDQWGTYDGMTYSTWEVNPPNPTGYSPTMMVFCMNDPGTGSAALNPLSTPDPLYNPGYSNFCYELPYMPGQTQYLDTPVVPTSAFSAGYNHPDCAYPDATPAISEVDGDGKGPWVSAPGKTLTITALGNSVVQDYAYSGPAATTAPFNQKTTTRHYGFGGQGSVTIGGVSAPIKSWSDSTITVTVPNGVPACAMQQQVQYGGSTASCGEVVVTTAAGKQSIDAVTVTIGGKAPTYVSGNVPLSQSGPGSIQQAIDAAAPGDLIMIPPGTYSEMLIMWKPVRLQGVGAASTIIDANTQPAGKLDPWRQQIVCLFGLALNGTPITPTNPYNPADPTNNPTQGASCPGNMNYFSGTTNNPQVDRLPLEGIVGWDTTTNGNLAQLLQEPTLLGAYEGAGITILSKGVNSHGAAGYYGSGNEAAFPTGTTVLTGSALDCGFSLLGKTVEKNPYPSNFQCNPSRIDGLTITDSSQGGGGIFAHAWAHNLEIANNRIYGNIGTLSGGINIGQGESPDAYLAGQTSDTDPGSCQVGSYTNQQLPYCFNLHVNVHHNMVTSNTSIGDELFSGTPAGAGGVSFCTGADYYNFQYNWICGNQSTGDGGGVAHIGFSYNGDIEHNTIIFNQSTNPTISTNGGGLIVMGAAPDGMTAAGVECGSTVADADCPPGLPDGTGPGLTINANLLMGNAAESGSGGGLRLQSVNGTEVSLFPRNPADWNHVTITNNIINNNVAGWDGAGVSLQDALSVDFINNTVASNDTTASAGVLFNTLGAPDASAPGAGNQTTSPTTSAPQPAGLVTMPNSSNLTMSLGNTPVTCPTRNPHCTTISNPYLANDVFWQNRSFYIGVGALSSQYQQNIVSLYNASFNSTPGTAAASQPSADATTPLGTGSMITGGTGACTPGASYWDIGVRGDSGPSNHATGIALSPTYSVITDIADYSTAALHNTGSNPNMISQYCNGARTPPEYASGGYQVPPGISDATVPNPIFNLSPSATVDEGNNWINISWGPLSETGPVTNTTLGNYGPSSSSSVINYIPSTAPTYGAAPSLDYYGTPRKTNNAVDAGAVEFVGATLAIGSVTGGPLNFGNVVDTTTSAARTLTLHNTGTGTLTGIAIAVTTPFSQSGGTCGATLNAGATCTINIVFSPTTPGAATGNATITGNVAITGSPVALTGTGVAVSKTATLTPATHNYGTITRGATQGILCLGANAGPCQAFTLSNTGNVAMTGITTTVNSAIGTNYYVIAGLTSCGATLNAGTTCNVEVQFRPPLTDAANSAQTGSLVITNTSGFPTLTSTLSGTAR